MEKKLPTGWQRVEDDSGKVTYLSRYPQVKISKKYQLEEYHKKGRYKEMSLSDLDFGTKKRKKKFSFVKVEDKVDLENLGSVNERGGEVSLSNSVMEFDVENVIHVEDEVDDNIEHYAVKINAAEENKEFEDGGCEGYQCLKGRDDSDENEDLMEGRERQLKLKKKNQVDNERKKLVQAVEKLTLNRNEAVDHAQSLAETSRILNEVRNDLAEDDQDIHLGHIKSELDETETAEDLVRVINNCNALQRKLSSLEHSRILEQLMRISSHPDNPLINFPLSINRNHYSDIMNFALKHAPDVLALVLRVTTKKEAPIDQNDVVRSACMFSSLACSVSRVNNALKKTKSAVTKNNGITNSGLDMLASIGIMETSRSYRNDRDFLASLSDHLLRSYAKVSVPQITFDNMDMTVGNVMHHMTLSYLEFETEDTSALPTDEREFETALEYFKLETVVMTSDLNKSLFEHYKYVTAWTLGKLLGEEVEGFAWLKSVFPTHYEHPNSGSSARKSTVFTQKPLNFRDAINTNLKLKLGSPCSSDCLIFHHSYCACS